MADELVVRLYNIGLGDCIYVGVPDDDDMRHLLIDCGNKYSSGDLLEAALEDLRDHVLPDAPDGKKRLDLIVVSHPHEDHVKGFDSSIFEDFQVGDLWLSAAMDPDHPQAEESRSLHAFAMSALEGLELRSLAPSEQALVDSLLSLSKAGGVTALLDGLGQPDLEPRYVHADTPAADLAIFQDPDNSLSVLAPMENIDGYYLGRDTDDLNALRAFAERAGGRNVLTLPRLGATGSATPSNISQQDFDRLRSRLLDNVMSFILKAGHLVNNTSVVLLLEWRGRRLLFTGDAEVKLSFKGAFREGKSNYSWNVMWHERRDQLDGALDFLKVGHHGSVNATPWTTKTVKGPAGAILSHPVNEILDAILPEDNAENAVAVVSTRRTSAYETIPDPDLMEELGRRVDSTATYDEPQDLGVFVADDVEQPLRTDMEEVDYLEIRFPEVGDYRIERS
jgi:beta-lactamase superfamily II metal-dependent hydrolase